MSATTKALIVLLLGLSASVALAAASSSGERVICVSGDSALERHAAEEFLRYAAEITGRKPEVSSAALAGDGKVMVCVGENALTEALLHRGLVQLPADTGKEGFVVRSAEADGKKYLVLLGGSPLPPLA